MIGNIIDELNNFISKPKIVNFKKGKCAECGKKAYLLQTSEVADRCECMELTRDNVIAEIKDFKEWNKKRGAK